MRTLLVPLLLSATAHAQFFEARTTAMGGAGVAAARYWAAPLANPALLARSKRSDDFAFVLPALGALVADEDDLIDAFEDLEDAVDALQASITAGNDTLAQRQDVVNRVLALDGKTAVGQASANFVFAFPSDDGIAFALVGRSFLEAQAFALIDPADAARILTASSAADLDSLQSEGVGFGAMVADIGLAIATGFELGDISTLRVGVTPKFQQVYTYNYSVNAAAFETDDFRDSRFRDDDSAFNIDVGAALELPAGFSVGLMGRDLVEADYDSVLINGRQFRYHVDTMVTLGAAWEAEPFTVTAEIDATETDPFRSGMESRFLRGGAELDFGWVQLRGGARFDVESEVDELYSAGIGLSPGQGPRLEVTGMIAEDETYGAVVQFGWTF